MVRGDISFHFNKCVAPRTRHHVLQCLPGQVDRAGIRIRLRIKWSLMALAGEDSI